MLRGQIFLGLTQDGRADMKSKTLTTQEHFWTVTASRIEQELWSVRELIWTQIGLYLRYGPRDERFAGDSEGKNILAELTKFLLLAVAHELQARMVAGESPEGRGVGRPINNMVPSLGPNLVAMFECYH